MNALNVSELMHGLGVAAREASARMAAASAAEKSAALRALAALLRAKGEALQQYNA